MTFDSQIASTAESALGDLATKVSGMTGWSIVDDSHTAADGGYVVFGTPSGIGEQVLVDAAQVSVGPVSSTDRRGDDILAVQTGLNWDSGSQSWGTQGAIQYGNYNHSSHDNWPANNSPTDSVEYWLGYVAGKGFYYYVRRDVGDGEDRAYGCGYSLVETEFWDYHSAATSSGYAGGGIVSAVASDQKTSSVNYTPAGQGQELDVSYGGKGLLNPDTNFTNYMWDAQVLRHNPTTNGDTGFTARCARAYPVWLTDLSGSSINSGDVVQDAGGTDEYMILNYHGARATISME